MKTTAFFCEHCGNPVPLEAKTCPHCGRRFDAVRCPICSLVGDQELFADGCPRCGYLKRVGGAAASTKPLPKAVNFEAASPEEETSAKRLRPPKRPVPRFREAPRTRLPRWFYLITIFVLLAVIVALIALSLRPS